MDAEQVRNQMRSTRARIDEKLEVLAVRTAAAGQQTARAVLVAVTALTLGLVLWAWRRRVRRDVWV